MMLEIKAKFEEEEGEVLVACERRGATDECLGLIYRCQNGWLSEQCRQTLSISITDWSFDCLLSRLARPTLDRHALLPHELQPPGRPTGHETRALKLLHEPFVAGGRAHGRGGLG